MYFNGYEVAAMVCAFLALAFLLIGVLTDYFEVGGMATIIFIILAITLYVAGDVQTKNEIRSVIEENYENCVFADDNTFFWNDKVYEYKLNKYGSKVNVMYQEGGTKKVATYELEKSK
jgi:hypothetical protein